MYNRIRNRLDLNPSVPLRIRFAHQPACQPAHKPLPLIVSARGRRIAHENLAWSFSLPRLRVPRISFL